MNIQARLSLDFQEILTSFFLQGGMSKEVWEGVTVVRTCDSPKVVCQSFERCDGHGER